MGQHYTIKPLNVGWLTVAKAQLVWGQGYGERVDIPVLMFLIEGNRLRVLVDTGCSDPEWSAKHHYPLRRSRSEGPLQALAAGGVAPEDIDIVVSTHLHWDHCYNQELFTNARFLIQRTELQFAAAPYPIFANAYEAPTTGMTPPYSRTRFDVLDGDLDLADGLKLVFAPGHTPGMQCVVANTSHGVYYIAGDNVALYENLEANRFGRPIPGVNFVNLGEYYETLRRMDRLAAHVLPGHDAKVLDKPIYP